MYCLHVISKSRQILLKQGLLPSRNKQKFRIMKMMLHIIVNTATLSVLILNIVKGIKLNEPMFINRMIWLVIPVISFLAKLLAIHKNKKYYLFVIKNLKSNIFNIHDKQLNQHILLIEKISGLMWKYFGLTIGVMYLVSCVLPVIIDTEPLMPCPVNIGKYDIIYRFLHLLFMFYYAINSPGFDLLLMSLLGICIAQLNILKQRLICLGDSDTENVNAISEHVGKTLRECITLHKMINRYVENITVLLSMPLFIQYTCGCFIICNTVLQLTIMGGKTTVDVVLIGAYTCVTFSQMAAYHWLGNEIIYKSWTVIDACYLSQWYTLDQMSQKCLILLMERAKRPLTVKLYAIAYISLESLTVIIRWSYSLFAIMKATYN